MSIFQVRVNTSKAKLPDRPKCSVYINGLRAFEQKSGERQRSSWIHFRSSGFTWLMVSEAPTKLVPPFTLTAHLNYSGVS